MNRTADPSLSDIQRDLHRRLFAWMGEERDYLRKLAHHLPIGSYVDGRDRLSNPDNRLPDA